MDAAVPISFHAGSVGNAAYAAQALALLPRIAVVTPTKNRSQHLPYQATQLALQNYPPELITWVITDSSDSDENSWHDVADYLVGTGLRHIYHRLPATTTLGASRNIGLDIVSWMDPVPEYIFFMDDDDIVGYNRIRVTLAAFAAEPDKQVAGCSRVLLFLLRGETLVEIGSYTDLSGGTVQHALEPTLAVTRDYAVAHRFDDDDPRGLLGPFLAGFTAPVIQLAAEDICVIIGHDTSTFDKYQIIREEKKTMFNVHKIYYGYGLRRLWDDWRLDAGLRELFMNAHGDSMNDATKSVIEDACKHA